MAFEAIEYFVQSTSFNAVTEEDARKFPMVHGEGKKVKL